MMISTLYWMKRHRPEIYDRIRYVLSPKDYIRFRLSGELGTDVTDAGGKLIAHIVSKILSFHERRIVDMADGTHFELSNEILHIIKDVTNIEGLGWQLRGNIIGLDFQLYDKNGDVIAVISQKAVSIKDKYCIDIYQPQHEAVAVTILVALQHMIRDRENGG